MRRLTVSTEVAAPSDFSLSFLDNYFRERSKGAAADARLRFPLERIAHGLTLEKHVAVRLFYPNSSQGRRGERLELRWNPEGRGPFPNFDGTIHAAAADPEHCTLTIAGEYVPPGGIAGAVFDVVAGARIAHATLNALLRDFRELIESDYRIRTTL
jgi:hypothetical protein